MMTGGTENSPRETQIIQFDSGVYRLDSVKRAAHKFLPQLCVLIAKHDAVIEVQIQPKECCELPAIVIGDFCNEVLDQELREQIADETREIRNLLLAQAFSKTSLIDPESESAEYDTKTGDASPKP